MEPFLFALLLTLLAGLSTTFGCVIAFFVKKPTPGFISLIMGFSAGVMIFVSFVELLQIGIQSNGFFTGMMYFFLGMFIMFLIDVTITHEYEFEESFELMVNGEAPKHHHQHVEGKQGHGYGHGYGQGRVNGQGKGHRHRNRQRNGNNKVSLEKASALIFLGIFIHNFPEGMATFVGTLKDIELGIVLAMAIALHNIPEGIAVSVPIYASTKSRKKAFFWSFLSGISEFLGALLVGLILLPIINDAIIGALLAIVAGIMIYISLDELLPVAHSLGKEHVAIVGMTIGMFVMFLSLTPLY